jgi:hypothetical protein
MSSQRVRSRRKDTKRPLDQRIDQDTGPWMIIPHILAMMQLIITIIHAPALAKDMTEELISIPMNLIHNLDMRSTTNDAKVVTIVSEFL